MIQVIEQFFKQYQIDIDAKFVIGVSTGVDSMVLLHLLMRLIPHDRLIVAHINHTRRSQSEQEEAYIKDFCEKSGMICHVMRLVDDDFQDGNFQDQARQYRYQFFKQVIQKEKASYLVLAHHLNDDIETIIMRMMRGSSLKALAGMDEYVLERDYILIRPLLRTLKQALQYEAHTHSIFYFEDESNAKDIYTRNHIRHNIIEPLFKQNPNAHLFFLALKDNLTHVSLELNALRDQYIAHIITSEDHGVQFSKQAFLALESFMQNEVLFEVLRPFHFSKVNIEEIKKWIASSQANLKLVYKQITFIKAYDTIRFVYHPVYTNRVSFTVSSEGVYLIDENRLIRVTKKSDKSMANPDKIWYNMSMLPVVIRNVQEGDTIAMEYGTKKVARLLIDAKVDRLDREKVLVLEKEGLILAVFGYAKSIELRSIEHCDLEMELFKENEEC